MSRLLRWLVLLVAVLATATWALPAGAQATDTNQQPGPEGWMQFPATWGYCENFYDADHVYWCYLENDQTWVRMSPNYWDQLALFGPTG